MRTTTENVQNILWRKKRCHMSLRTIPSAFLLLLSLFVMNACTLDTSYQQGASASTTVIPVTPTLAPTPTPTSTSPYCNKFHYIGGEEPWHLIIGHCLIQSMKERRWSISNIASILQITVCREIPGCFIALKVLAAFIHSEVDHIYNEDLQCGGQGVYIDVYLAHFRTRPVC